MEYLFGKPPPRPGEKGYLAPGFHRNDEGKIVDDEGNLYDEQLRLVAEAPSEGLQEAREQHPGADRATLSRLGKIYGRRKHPEGKEKRTAA